jgi:hypothetical protein
MIPVPLACRKAPGPRQQHRVRGEGRVADEGRLLAGVEEAHPQVVIGCGRGRYKGDLGMGKLTRDARHDRIAFAIRVEYDTGRITPETCARERIDLKDSHPHPAPRRLFGCAPQFCTPPSGTLQFRRILGVVLGA